MNKSKDSITLMLYGTVDPVWGQELRKRIDDRVDLRLTFTAEQAEKYWPDTQVLFTWGRQISHKQFLKAKALKWIHSLSAGVDGLLFPELIENDIVLTSSKGVHAVAMAHHTVALMLALVRRLDLFFRAQSSHKWIKAPEDPPLSDLDHKTLAIVGLGETGTEVARIARALGMKIIASRRHPSDEDLTVVDDIFTPDQIKEMLAEADIVVVSCPLTDETRGLFDRETFSSMKPRSFFINLSRGQVVDEAAMIEALNSKHLRGAGLDVFAEEPLPPESPLWDMDSVIITPHVAVDSGAIRARALDLAKENLHRYLAGQPLRNVVDKRLGY